MKPFARSPLLAALLLAASSLVRAEEPKPAPVARTQLSARSIGPAGMSGRVAAIEALVSDPRTIYVGAATGGLWRTRNAGLSWENLMGDAPVASIGAIAVNQQRPDIIWVGTGEGNPRNSASVGKGIWKSIDGGHSFVQSGLAGTEKIHRILLHPHDPLVAYAAALGTSWGESQERGVFRTRDGGASWERVLFVDERTGCGDLALDPSNPDHLLAGMWDHRRQAHFFRSGGPGSGLQRTLDGGDTWVRIEEGLPAGELGRIGLAFAPSQPDTIYALVEAEESALLRSEDGGFSWKSVNTETNVSPRPFYYADIRVDPADPRRLYELESVVRVSEDAGASFQTLIPWSLVHPDHHALWIHPEDPDFLIDGNDGGVAISRDRGKSWRFVRNLPLAQFYHVAVDDQQPYNIYGGMQDNGSWRGPSAVWENGGIRNHHWQEIGFGDGFGAAPMSDDSTRGYSMSQGGMLMRWRLDTGERKLVRPAAPAGVELRFNWNAALALDPFDPAGAYYGSQFVHRTRDRGDSWEIISPDLTTDKPEWQRQRESGGLTLDVTAAENYCSILCIAPSPLDPLLVWVCTDDGRLHLTRDGGASWTSLEGNVIGVPENTWIPHVEASKHDRAVAYVVFDDHYRANWTPYVYRTADHGVSWTSLATEELDGYVHVIEEDPVDPALLFLGTEFGLWISRDGGRKWQKQTEGFPSVSVRSLVVHPREHDLVVGTHGRAAFVIDDISPLRACPEARERELFVHPCRGAWLHNVKQTGESRFPATEEYRGQNLAYGASISFRLDRERAQADWKARATSKAEGGEQSASSSGAPPESARVAGTDSQAGASDTQAGASDIPTAALDTQTAATDTQTAATDTTAAATDSTAAASDTQAADASTADEGAPRAPAAGASTATTATAATAASGATSTDSDENEESEDFPAKAQVLVYDAEGALIRSFETEAVHGLNRFVWDLRRKGYHSIGFDPLSKEEPDGPEVLPGLYRLHIEIGPLSGETEVLVRADPREDISIEDRRANLEAQERLGRASEEAALAVLRIQRLRKDIELVLAKADEAKDPRAKEAQHPHAALVKAGKQLLEELQSCEELYWDPPPTKGIVEDRSASSELGSAAWFVGSSHERPTAAQLQQLELGEERLRAAQARQAELRATPLADFQRLTAEAGIGLLGD